MKASCILASSQIAALLLILVAQASANAGEPAAGMMLPPMKGIPPHWLTYFVVEDCAKSVSKAKSLGAEVFKDTTTIPEMGRFAVLGDPEEAAFGIMEFA